MSTYAERIRAFTSSSVAAEMIKSHLEKTEENKNKIINIIIEDVINVVESALADYEQLMKTGEMGEKFKVHNTPRGEQYFRLIKEENERQINAVIDIDSELYLTLEYSEELWKKVVDGACSCIVSDKTLVKTLSGRLESLFPKDSNVFLKIETPWFDL